MYRIQDIIEMFETANWDAINWPAVIFITLSVLCVYGGNKYMDIMNRLPGGF